MINYVYNFVGGEGLALGRRLLAKGLRPEKAKTKLLLPGIPSGGP